MYRDDIRESEAASEAVAYAIPQNDLFLDGLGGSRSGNGGFSSVPKNARSFAPSGVRRYDGLASVFEREGRRLDVVVPEHKSISTRVRCHPYSAHIWVIFVIFLAVVLRTVFS